MTTLAFDVYGTLIDPAGIAAAIAPKAGAQAAEFARRWREKQLEYAFRRGLMQAYADFDRCTREAFQHTAATLRIAFTSAETAAALEAYAALPAFADVSASLAAIRATGARMFAFSNGVAATVDRLLRHAGVREFFEDLVSVDEIGRFKPDPGVYRHFLARADSTPAETWLVSSNPFDVIGARSAGLRAAWVRRSPDAPFDPWGVEPTATVASLADLAGLIAPAATTR